MTRTKEQRRAIETYDKSLCVDAGAGSGKTSVLVDRILYLLEHRHATLDQIVAITFTDKAAAEMKERLRSACRKKALDADPETLTFWRHIERHLESARISTIHSFCMGLLKVHALSLKQDPDFGILTEPESHLLRLEVVEQTFHTLLEAGDPAIFRLATEFRQAELFDMVRTMLNDRSVLARIAEQHDVSGADTLLADWNRVVQAHVEKQNATLAASPLFTEAVRELKALAGQCPDPMERREILRRSLVAELDRAAQAMTNEERESAFAAICALNAIGGSKKKWASEDAYNRVREIMKGIKEAIGSQGLAPVNAEHTERAAALTADLFRVYMRIADALAEAKQARNAYDFEDLIAQTLHVLRDNSRGDDSVRARVARTIRFLLIDEFQDTDSVQLEIARLLAGVDGGPQLFIVGDAKQSIYYFRGAEVEVFRSAREAADETIRMDQNFRSLPDVLTFVNDFFSHSYLLKEVEDPYGPMRWHRDETGGCHIEFLIPETIENAKAPDYRDAEAALLANRILNMCSGPSPAQVFDTDKYRNASFGDAAILLRSFSDVYRYERALRQAGVPYAVVSGTGFYERQEVLDLRNLLTVLVDPWNEMALLAVLRGPVAALSDDALVRLSGFPARGQGLAAAFYSEALTGDARQDERLTRTRELLAELRQFRDLPLNAFVHRVLDRSELEAIVLGQFLGVQRAMNLRKVANLASAFARTQNPTLASFVRYLGDVASTAIREGEADAAADAGNAVTLMTVHKSKGLEFPIVAIADMGRDARGGNRGALAHHRSMGISLKVTDNQGERVAPPIYQCISQTKTAEELAEQARVLYVAMTRARDYLLLCGPPDAKKETQWLTAFDKQYALFNREDGAELAGTGWRAQVRRRGTPVHVQADRAEEPPVPEPSLIAARIAPVPVPESTGLSLAVTTALGALDDREHDQDEHLAAGRGDAAARGTLIHRFLELWDFAANPNDLIEELLLVECPERELRARLHEELPILASRIADSEVGKLIRENATRRREVPFALRMENRLLRGTVDLILDDGTIIDYKTGRRTPENHAKYERQLRIYAAASRGLGNLAPTRAYLLYLDDASNDWLAEVDITEPLVEVTIQELRSQWSNLKTGVAVSSS